MRHNPQVLHALVSPRVGSPLQPRRVEVALLRGILHSRVARLEALPNGLQTSSIVSPLVDITVARVADGELFAVDRRQIQREAPQRLPAFPDMAHVMHFHLVWVPTDGTVVP